jgi:predicted negative regulator of RcsB-dependent stress response
MKKIVKKQLKEDEFVSTMTKIMHFFQKRTKEIIIGVAAIVFVGLVYTGVHLIRAQQIQKESRLITQLLELRSTAASKPENLAALEKMGGDGKYARLGHVLTATYWVEQGNLTKAKESLGKIKSSPQDFIYFQAQDLLGQVETMEKDYDGAIAIYAKIEELKPKDYCLDAALFHKAEALEAKGSKTEALAAYKKLQEEFPQSYYGYDAGERARKIEGAAAGL